MHVDFKNWEHGSNFYWPDLSINDDSSNIGLKGSFVGSGRVALLELLRFGYETRGWKRLWIPSYYCEDVVLSLQCNPVIIKRYSCGPVGEDVVPEAQVGDVLLRVSYFGWGLKPLDSEFGGDVIEDHSHDPHGGLSSNADFVFASLRKTFPVPDGGMFWSPQGDAVPAAPPMHSRHEAAALNRLAAMVSKRAYLQGFVTDKSSYRQLEMASEELLLEGNISGISSWSKLILDRLPFENIRLARVNNYKDFRAAIVEFDELEILGPEILVAPTMAIVRIRNIRLRDALRSKLNDERIYTAVLWPMRDVHAVWYRQEDLDFSNETLAVHVDSRYSPDDMRKVAYRIGAITQELVSEQ